MFGLPGFAYNKQDKSQVRKGYISFLVGEYSQFNALFHFHKVGGPVGDRFVEESLLSLLFG